jgi:hypothetical protein
MKLHFLFQFSEFAWATGNAAQKDDVDIWVGRRNNQKWGGGLEKEDRI